MSSIVSRRETLPASEEAGAVSACAACGERVMLICREGPDTAQVECTACGVALRVLLSDGCARMLHLLPPFHLTGRAHSAHGRDRSRADLYRLFNLTPPA